MIESMNNIIKIKCPTCGAILSVLDDPSNEGKSVRCPACKEKHRFVEFKLVSPLIDEDKTCIGPSIQDGDHTELPSMSKSTIGFLLNKTDNQKYRLIEGLNLIGRKTFQQESAASVPIATEDRGFSRKHLYIEVVKGADGIFRHYAFNAANKNETRINGLPLEEGDKVILHSGDQIESSNTTLIFNI